MRHNICKWIHRVVSLTLLISVFSLPAFARNDYAEWKMSAMIQTKGTHRYKSFYLNRSIYRHTHGELDDLRIANGHGETLPYIIQNAQKDIIQSEAVLSTRLMKVFQKKKDTYFDFAVVQKGPTIDPIGNVLCLTFSQDNFLKNVALYGSYDGERWEYIQNDQLFQIDDLKKNEIILPQDLTYSYFRLVFLNNSENITLFNAEWINRRNNLSQRAFQRSLNLPLSQKTFSEYTLLTIKNRDKLNIRSIQLQTDGNFRRPYRVWHGVGNDTPPCASGEIYRLRFKEISVDKTAIDLPEPSNRHSLYRIKIINGDNRPVSIQSIKIVYSVDKIIFETVGPPPYRLYFNHPKAQRPSYDMESFTAHILKEPQDPAVLGAISNRPNRNKEIFPYNSKVLFNLVVMIIGLILIGFLVIKLKPTRNA